MPVTLFACASLLTFGIAEPCAVCLRERVNRTSARLAALEERARDVLKKARNTDKRAPAFAFSGDLVSAGHGGSGSGV